MALDDTVQAAALPGKPLWELNDVDFLRTKEFLVYSANSEVAFRASPRQVQTLMGLIEQPHKLNDTEVLLLAAFPDIYQVRGGVAALGYTAKHLRYEAVKAQAYAATKN